MQRFAPQFLGYDQHDTQELLAFLLDGLHEDLNRVAKKKFVEDVETDGSKDDLDEIALKAWSGYLERNKSIVVDLFQGQLRSTLKCLNRGCDHCCIKFESFMYLSVPIKSKSKTVEDCIGEFCQEEILDGDNQWYCSKCKDHVRAKKKLDLWKLPPVLIIHLKRFEFNRRGQRKKLETAIRTPVEDFNLSDLCASKQREDPCYDLYAVSNHHGGLGGGHYTAFARNRTDELWYDFNDATVTEIDASRVANNRSAYVLFYNRVVIIEVTDKNVSARVDGGGAGASKRVGRVRRQSVSMPHLWPHNLSTKTALNT